MGRWVRRRPTLTHCYILYYVPLLPRSRSDHMTLVFVTRDGCTSSHDAARLRMATRSIQSDVSRCHARRLGREGSTGIIERNVPQALFVVGALVAYTPLQALYSLRLCANTSRPLRATCATCSMLPLKSGVNALHQEFRRRLFQKCDRLGKMPAALVRQVVAGPH